MQLSPSAEDAERQFEPWLSEYPHLAVDSDGARYVFVAADTHVQLKHMPDEALDHAVPFAESEFGHSLRKGTTSASRL